MVVRAGCWVVWHDIYLSVGFPEEVGAHVDSATLVVLLQQLGGVHGGLGGQGVVVLLPEYPHRLQRACTWGGVGDATEDH